MIESSPLKKMVLCPVPTPPPTPAYSNHIGIELENSNPFLEKCEPSLRVYIKCVDLFIVGE